MLDLTPIHFYVSAPYLRSHKLIALRLFDCKIQSLILFFFAGLLECRVKCLFGLYSDVPEVEDARPPKFPAASSLQRLRLGRIG